MTEPIEVPDPLAAPSPNRWRLLAAVLGVIAVVAIAVAGYAFARDDDTSTAAMPMAGNHMSATMPMAMGDTDAMYEHCIVMMTPTGEPTSEDTATWCRDMADRMAQHMTNGTMPGGGMMTPPTTGR
jgi:hypothetical protein